MIVASLETAREGSRLLDRQIAEAIGWRREIREDRDPQGRIIERGIWFEPTSGKAGTIPNYTGDLEAAHSLAKFVAPESTGGCSWEDGAASARIGSGPYSQARTPAMALSCAALKFLFQTS
ncbi:MAG: hypothetical protein EOP06_00950 [Proteobacteria bacterium]|nr:MAG: hypothetical protein EOP06_00950 [Pseudomonadota bacterium]